MNILQWLSQSLDLLVLDEHPEPPFSPEMGISNGIGLPSPSDPLPVADPVLPPDIPFASPLDPLLVASPALPLETAPSGFWNTLSGMVQNLFSFDGTEASDGGVLPGQFPIDPDNPLQDMIQPNPNGMIDLLAGLPGSPMGAGIDPGTIHNVTHDIPNQMHFGGGGGTGFHGM